MVARIKWLETHIALVPHVYTGETGLVIRDPNRHLDAPDRQWYFYDTDQQGDLDRLGRFVPFQEQA